MVRLPDLISIHSPCRGELFSRSRPKSFTSSALALQAESHIQQITSAPINNGTSRSFRFIKRGRVSNNAFIFFRKDDDDATQVVAGTAALPLEITASMLQRPGPEKTMNRN